MTGCDVYLGAKDWGGKLFNGRIVEPSAYNALGIGVASFLKRYNGKPDPCGNVQTGLF